MASFNRVILIGNLTRDVQLEKTPRGLRSPKSVFGSQRSGQKEREWVDEPTFVDVILWGRTAEIAAEYLSKGSPVMFEGRLKLDMWEKDGQKRSKMRVVAERLQLLGTRGGQQRQRRTGAPHVG